MGLAPSIAVSEAHLLSLGLFTTSSKAVEPTTTKRPQGQEVVIMPVDQSPHSEAAFDWYVKHMHKSNNVLRLIHCNVTKKEAEENLRKGRTQSKALVEKYQEKLQTHQIAGSVHSEYGSAPGEMIIFSVDRYRGTQIVMGSRGLGVIQRSFMGSVSHYVLDHTKVPVTIIPKDVAA